MADERWMYARGQQQFGPVTLEQLKQLMHTGQVQGADLVWRDGMPQWVPAQSVAELRGGDAAPPIAAAVRPAEPATGVGAVPYYSGSAGMPPRAHEALKYHARPKGDVGDWPLDDGRVAVFAETARLRRRIVRAANTYRALMALTILGSVFMLFGMAAAISGTRRGGGGGGGAAAVVGIAIVLFIVVGFAVFYWFASRATMRSQRWAPLTVLIVWMALIGMNFLTLLLGTVSSRSTAYSSTIVGVIVTVILGGIVAIYSLQAMFAIPKYLAQPAWCQELAVRAEVDKKQK